MAATIFRYPGGKSKPFIQKWILDHKPAGVKEYREPFVGGGGIFFGLNASAVSKRWINDKHEGLIEVYKALRDRPAEFIAACRAIEVASDSDELSEEGPRGGRPTNARLKAKFEELKLNTECDQALRYYFVNRTVHGSGRVNYDIPSRLYFSNPEGWNVIKSDGLERAAEHLEGTKITCGDYEKVFKAAGEDVWIYADPPYVVNGNLSRTSQLYQHGFDAADHKRFAAVVAKCKHKVCISYDDDGGGIVRELFPADKFKIIEASWKYAGTTNETKEVGKELLILNYEPQSFGVVVPEAMQMAVPLTAEERSELEECELAIIRYYGGFVEAGKALSKIRDSGKPSQRLYRETHATFKEYCDEALRMSEVHANRLIAAAKRYEVFKTKPIGSVLPDTESQVRPLLRIESDDEAVQVWVDVVEHADREGKQITASLIREHVNEHLGIEPAPPRDSFSDILKLWGRCDPEVRALVYERIKQEMERDCDLAETA